MNWLLCRFTVLPRPRPWAPMATQAWLWVQTRRREAGARSEPGACSEARACSEAGALSEPGGAKRACRVRISERSAASEPHLAFRAVKRQNSASKGLSGTGMPNAGVHR